MLTAKARSCLISKLAAGSFSTPIGYYQIPNGLSCTTQNCRKSQPVATVAKSFINSKIQLSFVTSKLIFKATLAFNNIGYSKVNKTLKINSIKNIKRELFGNFLEYFHDRMSIVNLISPHWNGY